MSDGTDGIPDNPIEMLEPPKYEREIESAEPTANKRESVA